MSVGVRVCLVGVPLRGRGARLGGAVDDEMVKVAERLADEFPDVPSVVVVQAIGSCLAECSSQSPYFVEQAARARLCSQRATLEHPSRASRAAP